MGQGRAGLLLMGRRDELSSLEGVTTQVAAALELRLFWESGNIGPQFLSPPDTIP